MKFINQYSKWAGVCRYTMSELLVPEFHTGTYKHIPDVPKLWGAPPGALLALWWWGGGGERVVYKRDRFILNEMWAQDKI
jgi:hypothetical protein